MGELLFKNVQRIFKENFENMVKNNNIVLSDSKVVLKRSVRVLVAIFRFYNSRIIEINTSGDIFIFYLVDF